MPVTAAAQAARSRRRTWARRAQRGALAAPVTSSNPLNTNSAPLPLMSPSAPVLLTGVLPPEPPLEPPLEPFVPGAGVEVAPATCQLIVKRGVPEVSLTAC